MSEETKVTPEAEVKETKAPKKEKKNKKDSEIEKLKAELDSKNDLLLRTAAEFDNFKKRTERERAGIAEFAKSNVIKELLPILDNIDRSGQIEDKTSADYIKGIEMIVKQFEALGENTIAAVLQKGYKIGDTVIRPAMVSVAN